MFQFDPAHIVLAVLAGSLILFVTDALRYDLVALLVVIVLALSGTLSPNAAFEGFASPAVILIAAMFIFGHAFSRCGIAETLGHRLLAAGNVSEVGLVVRVTLVAGLLSAVLSNTGVVATLIPVCIGLANRLRIPVSRLLMPMAFGSLLGGLVTVVGTSTNVLINEIIESRGFTPFGVFEFSLLGLCLVAVGGLYFWGPGRLLLPRSPIDQSLEERYQVPKFITELLVEPASTLINRSVADVEIFDRYHVNVLGIVRSGGENSVLAPGPYNRIRADDTLILQGAPEDILQLSREMPMKQRPDVDTPEGRLYSDDVQLLEAVIPAGSRFVGQSLTSSEFRTRTQLNVLAIAKHGELQLKRIQEIVLEVGDTLLIQGHVRDIERARTSRQVLVLDALEHPRRGARNALAPVALLAAVLLAATLTNFSLSVLALAGAMGLVLLRAVRVEEIYRVIDWSVLILVGGMLALGRAFDQVDLSRDLAQWLQSLGHEGLTPFVLMLIVLGASIALTQVLNNVATAVIMAPLAIDLAGALGINNRPFLMAVVVGSSLAFLSPVAHQANAMVMGPGGYKYRDFLRVGTPLAIITALVAAALIPVFFPFF